MRPWVAVGLVMLVANAGMAEEAPLVNQKLSLDEATGIALKQSPVVRGASAEVDAAAGELNAARAARRPIVSANGFLAGGHDSSIVAGPEPVQPQMIMGLPGGEFADGNLMLMFPLYTSGRLQAMVRQAAARQQASQADLQAQQQEVMLLTRVTYREVLARRAQVAVARARQSELEERLRLDRVNADQGKIPPFYVLRDETELAASRQELTNSERDVELSLAQLKMVMGVSPGSNLELTDNLDYQPSAVLLQELKAAAPPVPPPLAAPGASPDLAALWLLAERRRPELQAATNRLQAAEQETTATRRAFQPQVNLFAAGDIMKIRGMDVSGGAAYGLAASVPILDGGLRRARTQTTRAEQQRLVEDRRKMAQQVSQEVTTAWLNLQAAEQNVGTAQAAVTSAQEDYRVARLRYDAGKSILVELLDALTARTRAESNAVAAGFAYWTARDQLQRATGTLIVKR